MKLIERKDIDAIKWNKRIAKDSAENVFSYTWYLDAVCEAWAGLISDDDYTTILPIPYTLKFGIKRFYQAPFTREFTIFGTDFNWTDALLELKKSFKHFGFRSELDDLAPNKTIRSHQVTDLSEDYRGAYSTNAKRLIKKGLKSLHFKTFFEAELLINLFEINVAYKIDSIDAEHLRTLTQLMKNAMNAGTGEIIGAFNEEEELMSACFFLKDKTRITYLKGAATDQGKKDGAMFALLDYAFERYSTTYRIFDFGGSDIESIATFFKKLGGEDRFYYDYTIDNTPRWFRTLKKMKG